MKKTLLLLVLLTFVAGCNKSTEPHLLDSKEPKTPSISEAEQSSGLPFENISSLRSLNKENINVDYLLSRKAALIEMEDFSDVFLQDNPEGNFSLSERPIIVRDENNEAKLYEYIVFNSKMKPIATIANFAKMEAEDFTAFVLPYVRDYKSALAQKFSLGYPYNASNNREDNLRAYRDNYGIPNEDCSVFWDKAKSWGKALGEKSDSQIIREHKNNLKGIFSTKTKWYTIPQFDKENLKRTRFSGACGPSALAWVYRGFYPTFEGNYIPLHGEASLSPFFINLDDKNNVSWYSSNNPLVKAFEKGLGLNLGIVNFPDAMTPGEFDDMVAKHFPEHKIGISTWPSAKGAPRREIQNGNPVYLLVFSGIEMHYLIGFGTKDKYTWFGIHNDSWIYVTDNGTNTQKHGYLPYYRNSNFFNITNKYVSMGAFIRK